MRKSIVSSTSLAGTLLAGAAIAGGPVSPPPEGQAAASGQLRFRRDRADRRQARGETRRGRLAPSFFP